MISIITTGIALILIHKAIEIGRGEESVIEYRSTDFYWVLLLVFTAVVFLKAF
jgi:hypothetical protein